MTVPNRVVLPAMDMNLCEDGEIEKGDIDHFVARAAGGTGLIITGCCAVAYPLGCTSRKEPGLSEDRFIPGLKALADAVHDAGSKLCVQMTHHGKVARIDTLDGRPQLVPSTPKPPGDMSAMADCTPEELGKMAAINEGKRATYHEATKEDLDWLVRMFAEAAGRVKAAGGDAVEIHCAHNYVLGAFLSRYTNQRSDEYGGSMENRARLACEVIRAVKEEVGGALAVIVRLAGQEYGETDGLTVDEAAAAAKMFEEAGADAIHVTGTALNAFANFTDGPLPDKVGYYTDNATRIKQAISIPVITVGRMLPEVGEKMIAEGRTDFAAMGPPAPGRSTVGEQTQRRCTRAGSALHQLLRLRAGELLGRDPAVRCQSRARQRSASPLRSDQHSETRCCGRSGPRWSRDGPRGR